MIILSLLVLLSLLLSLVSLLLLLLISVVVVKSEGVMLYTELMTSRIWLLTPFVFELIGEHVTKASGVKKILICISDQSQK